jgi:hypothetical protein
MSNVIRNWAFLSPLFAAILLLTPAASAQDASGRIVGAITDASGAVVPGARVTATNVGTQATRETLSDKDGQYQVLELPIGVYRVAAEHPGFNRAVTGDQKLLINQSMRLDLSLTVGQTTETVAVQAQASGVETVNATLGQSVTSRPLVNLPLNGRNVLDLALLQPGVTETNSDSTTAAGRFSIAGGRTDSVTYLLDGGINNHILNNDIVFSPNPDTVAEFRILTSNYTAEYGRNGAGIISVVTKSGTNEVHGSLFEFVRNDAFNANTFFNNENGQPKPILKRNQFGATIGAPISIPHLFSGRDKFFFFIGYQGQREVRTVFNPAVTTFTPAQLGGDFSQAASGGPDPGVASFLQANPFFQPNPALAARGVIDPTRINSVAQSFIKAGLIPTSPTGQIFPQGSAITDSDELTEKLDFVFTQKDRLSVTLGSSRNPRLEPFPAQNNAGPTVSGYADTNNDRRYFANLAYTKVFTPTLLNEARFTAQRVNHLQAIPVGTKPTASDLGIGITPDNPTGPPLIVFNSGLTVGFSPNGPTREADNAFVYSDTLSWTKGRHNLRMGATFGAYQNNTLYDFYVNGSFTFSGSAGGIGTQNDLADFLLGLPDQYTQFGQAPSNIRSKSYSAFFQDEWRVKRNLVVTLGLRYEYSTPKLDTQGRSFSIIPGLQSTRFPNAPLGLVFPGDKGAPRGANFPDKNDWAPRFGFAWDPKGNGRTSIRGGFGMFYDVLKGEDNLQFNGQAPFFGFAGLGFDPVSNVTSEVPYFGHPFASNNSGTPNSFPSRPPAQNIDFGAAGFLPFGGGGVFFVDPHLRTPYVYQYNLSWQQQVTGSLTSELSYVGSSSHKLTGLVDINPFILGTNTRLLNTQPGLDTLSGFSFLDSFENIGKAHYNSLQASLQKRLSSTLVGDTYFTLAYTYAHNIDNTSGFRQSHSNQVPYYNHDAFLGSADTDIRHRIVFSGGWDLPFDRMWESGPKRLTRGWSLYPIATWRTGFPLDILPFFNSGSSRTDPGPSGAGDRGITRANLIGSRVITLDPHRPGNFYFDPSNFEQPVNGQGNYGTLGRNAFRGPNRANFDLALAKTTALIGERVSAEFRAEFFNILNHTQFDNPNVNNFGSSTFGQVTTTADPRIIQLALRLRF